MREDRPISKNNEKEKAMTDMMSETDYHQHTMSDYAHPALSGGIIRGSRCITCGFHLSIITDKDN